MLAECWCTKLRLSQRPTAVSRVVVTIVVRLCSDVVVDWLHFYHHLREVLVFHFLFVSDSDT